MKTLLATLKGLSVTQAITATAIATLIIAVPTTYIVTSASSQPAQPAQEPIEEIETIEENEMVVEEPIEVEEVEEIVAVEETPTVTATPKPTVKPQTVTTTPAPTVEPTPAPHEHKWVTKNIVHLAEGYTNILYWEITGAAHGTSRFYPDTTAQKVDTTGVNEPVTLYGEEAARWVHKNMGGTLTPIGEWIETKPAWTESITECINPGH